MLCSCTVLLYIVVVYWQVNQAYKLHVYLMLFHLVIVDEVFLFVAF